MSQRYSILLFCLIASLTSSALAASPPATKPSDADLAAIDALIKTGESDKVAQAVARIDALLKADAFKTAIRMHKRWPDELLKQKRYAEVVEITGPAVAAVNYRLDIAEDLQICKIKALLALGKNDVALGEAKSLYNVCAMKNAARAIVLVCDCLKAARPNGADLVRQFRLEQVQLPDAAADGDAKPAPAAGGRPGTVLSGVKVDGVAYLEAIDRETGDKFGSLWTWGNLLLMADKPAEAQKVFESAYRMASEKELGQATEALARAMRAQDGSVARANAWLLSLRAPEKHPATTSAGAK